MAMRAAATAAFSAHSRVAANSQMGMGMGIKALCSSFSSFPFNNLPRNNIEKPPPAEPSTNLFVSGLNKRTTSEGLRDAFAKFGEVDHAKVVTDRVSGFSKGFGFVKYATVADAEAGIKGMDGQSMQDHELLSSLQTTHLLSVNGEGSTTERKCHLSIQPNIDINIAIHTNRSQVILPVVVSTVKTYVDPPWTGSESNVY